MMTGWKSVLPSEKYLLKLECKQLFAFRGIGAILLKKTQPDGCRLTYILNDEGGAIRRQVKQPV